MGAATDHSHLIIHFPTSVRELRYMLYGHAPEDLDSCSVLVLSDLGEVI